MTLRNAFVAIKARIKAILLSVHNVNVETRDGPDGVEARVVFDSTFGPHATPWVSEEEAKDIVARITP